MLFLLFLCVHTGSFAASQEALDEQEKLKEIQKKLEISKKKLEETKKNEQNALAKLVVTKTKLAQAQTSLSKANKRIVVNQEQIQKLVSELRSTYENLNIKSKTLSNRLAEVYKNSSVNYLELLFSSTSMSDFINRSYFFSKIIERDTGLIKGISSDYSNIKQNKNVLIKTTNEIKEVAKEIGQQKEEITVQAQEIKELYGQLKDRRENFEKQVAELEKSSEEMEKVILAKISERKKQKIAVVGNTGSLDWPLRGRLTSGFGYRRHPMWGGRHLHSGIDIAAPHGEVIRAADGGAVIFAGWWDGYGKAIVIDHGNNISTVYGHMSRLYMQAGNEVKKGQIIGLVGSTGYSTGPHLHFEVRIKGKPQNPRKYLP